MVGKAVLTLFNAPLNSLFTTPKPIELLLTQLDINGAWLMRFFSVYRIARMFLTSWRLVREPTSSGERSGSKDEVRIIPAQYVNPT